MADGDGTAQINRESLFASKAEGISVLASLVLKGQDAHAEKVGSMDTFVAFSNDSLDSLKVGAFSGPIARGSRSVLFASKDDGRSASSDVLRSSLEDGHLFVSGPVLGHGAGARGELVDKADVSEGASGHDVIVSSASTVRVEVDGSNAVLGEPLSSDGGLGNVSSGRDVISCHGIAEAQKASSAVD